MAGSASGVSPAVCVSVACLVFALVAVPLGAQPRRGGRAAGSLIAVVVIASYYLMLVMGAGLARQGKVLPSEGIWIADSVLATLGFALLRGWSNSEAKAAGSVRLDTSRNGFACSGGARRKPGRGRRLRALPMGTGKRSSHLPVEVSPV